MHEVVYNVTVSVDPVSSEEWLNWMRTEHIPDVLSTGLFLRSQIMRIEGYEENGVTYAIQYTLASRQHLERYQQEFAPALQQKHAEKFGDKALAFRTVLEIIEKFHD